jgi:hypothetical protein
MDDLSPPIPAANNLDRLEDHFKEEITAVNAALPAKKFPVKKLLSILLGIFVVAAIPAGVLLVKQRQELRKEAVVGQCCSGTRDCDNDEQCVRDDASSCESKSVCKKTTLPQGCCSSDDDCAAWEKCIDGNGACPSNKSCRSQAGCSKDTDCLPGNKCQNGTCVGAGTLECSANETGVKITNNTSTPAVGNVSWFSTKCNDANCFCGGQPTTESVNLSPGASWSRAISGAGCSWQSDVKFSSSGGGISCENANHGCIANCGPTPTGRPTVTATPRPTATGSPQPTATATPRPTATATPIPGAPTPTPTSTRVGCQSSCSTNNDCEGGLTCYDFGNNVKKCVDGRCPNEGDCVCNKSCYELCGSDNECPSGLVCRTVDSVKRCVHPSCDQERDCDCSVAAGPTPTPVQLPAAGFALPTWGSIAAGAGLIIASLLLLL